MATAAPPLTLDALNRQPTALQYGTARRVRVQCPHCLTMHTAAERYNGFTFSRWYELPGGELVKRCPACHQI